MPPGGRLGPGFLTEEELKNKPKVTKSLLRRIFSYLIPYWKQMILVLLAIIGSAVLTLLPSVLTGKIIDEGLIARNLRSLVFYIL
ncbi:MAG: ABC transporter ATP-binding protein, partial [Oscillospiraceae bacterium]|nr:ABC transporter ATP-binding protein [Oscillospiraceae bacterium]